MSTRNVAVLAGGLSHEREVSLRSGRRLAAALRDAGLSVVEWDADASLIHRLRTDSALPSTPGSSRVTASRTTMTATSPPKST